MNNEEQSKKIKIPEKAISFIKDGVPQAKKLLAAKGLLPFEPDIIVTILCFLLADKDEKIRGTARESFIKLPDTLLINAINSKKLHGSILTYISKVKIENDRVIETLLLTNIPDETYSFIAKRCSSKMLDVITNDHARILEKPTILNDIKENPQILPHQIEKVASFLEVEKFYSEETIASNSERSAKVEEDLPTENSKFECKTISVDSEQQIQISKPDEKEEDQIPEELTKEADEIKDGTESEYFKLESIENKIRKMTVSQKIKLAMSGNREVRRIMLRDPNRMISQAVLHNRKITTIEIIEIAQSRMVSEEALRTIVRSKDWMKNYSVKVALIQNPKTPMSETMRLMQQVHLFDLRDMAHNKNIPSQISSLANRLYLEKTAKKTK